MMDRCAEAAVHGPLRGYWSHEWMGGDSTALVRRYLGTPSLGPPSQGIKGGSAMLKVASSQGIGSSP